MNVGVVVPGFSADTADWCIPALRDFARTLAHTNDVRVIAVRYPYEPRRYTIDNAQVIALGGATRRGAGTVSLWQSALRLLREEHRRKPFDLLHAFWATESGLLAALAARLLRIPCLVSLAGGELVGLPDIGYGDQLHAWERLKVAAALRLASAVSAGSRLFVEATRKRIQRPVQLLPLGVDTDRFTPSPSRPRSAGLLSVGSLVAVKDHHTLLDAVARLRQPACLDIVGDGPLRGSLERHADRVGLRDRVCFRGALDHGDLAAVYQSASTFVLSSRHEAQSMVALEAAGCGLPVVGTTVGVIPEIGCPVPVGDVDALARAMEQPQSTPLDPRFELRACTERFEAAYAALCRC